jgi:hypothetical protein
MRGHPRNRRRVFGGSCHSISAGTLVGVVAAYCIACVVGGTAQFGNRRVAGRSA